MSTTDLASPDRDTVREIFDGIAPQYDFMNNLLSFYLDGWWRREACRLLLEGKEETILDIGTGTGKFLDVFLKARSWQRAVGMDFSGPMLRQARAGLQKDVDLVSADFHELPFGSGSFDLAISGFTLRSVQDLDRFFAEVFRILRPKGKAGFLCLTRPQHLFWRSLYRVYLKYYVPGIGFFMTGQQKAYRFLSESIQSFQEPAETIRIMERAGFNTVASYPFTGGIATLMIAYK
ncbi:MAG: ubiquinone/menaquinone biosynthesis methyltransferase [Candidatus Omnitrophica bacterium]|nr:ubiquinone/menaquinone biosynthesis methyltransferase [Candidatus Omnitrophota bacterium]